MKKLKYILLSAAAAAALTVLPCGTSALAAESVIVDMENFPDAAFREYVRDNFDTDNDNVISPEEISAADKMDISDTDILRLDGIEYFTALKELRCMNSSLTSLDLSENTALTYLNCRDSQLTELDLRYNTELTYAVCRNNRLTKLRLGDNAALVNLDCTDNMITALDLSGCTALETVNCYNNRLTRLELGDDPSLTGLWCYNNRLTELDLSGAPALVNVNCSDNRLTSLDLSGNTALKRFTCSGNPLEALKTEGCAALEDLSCNGGSLDVLDLSSNTALKKLSCSDNILTSLDVSANTELLSLSAAGNRLVSIDLRDNEKLRELSLNGNPAYFAIHGRVDTYPQVYAEENNIPFVDVDSVEPVEPEPEIPIDEEKAGDFVERLYTRLLGRASEPEGKENHLTSLRRGRDAATVARGFLESPEFISKNLSNEEYISRMYSAFLGRAAYRDPASANWVLALYNGCSRELIFHGFVESDEFTSLCEQYGIVRGSVPLTQNRDMNPEVTSFVTQLYRNALGTENPDAAGLNGWTGAILEGGRSALGTVAHGFIFSEQFVSQYPSDEAFVRHIYPALFGREASDAECADWISAMNAEGVGREQVFDGFIGSMECNIYFDSFGI